MPPASKLGNITADLNLALARPRITIVGYYSLEIVIESVVEEHLRR